VFCVGVNEGESVCDKSEVLIDMVLSTFGSVHTEGFSGLGLGFGGEVATNVQLFGYLQNFVFVSSPYTKKRAQYFQIQ
jgi:hypothetical protein